MAVSAAEEGKQSKQAEQEGDHRAGMFSGSAPPDQSLGAGRSFGEGQEVGPPPVCVPDGHTQPVIADDALRDEHPIVVPEERASHRALGAQLVALTLWLA